MIIEVLTVITLLAKPPVEAMPREVAITRPALRIPGHFISNSWAERFKENLMEAQARRIIMSSA